MPRRLIALLYALTIAGYALSSSIPYLFGGPSRNLNAATRALSFVICLVVIGYLFRASRMYRGAAWLPLLAFWLFYGIRMAMDTVFRPITLELPGYMYAVWGFGSCFIPLLAFFWDPGDKTLRLAAKYCWWACAAGCIVATYVAYLELASGMSDAYFNGRLSTESLNPISLGHLGVSLALLSLCYIPTQRLIARVVSFGFLIFGLFIAAAAGSRGPLIAFAAGALLLLWIAARGKPLHTLVLGFVVTLVAAGMLVGGAFFVEETFGFRIITRFGAIQDIGSEGSARQHVEMLADARREFFEHPVFGNALEETNAHEYPHNVIVESFMATGVIGGFMFCAFLLWSCLATITLAKRPETRWLAVLTVQQIMASLLSGALYLSAGMWCFSVAAIAIAANRRREAPDEHPVTHTIASPHGPAIAFDAP